MTYYKRLAFSWGEVGLGQMTLAVEKWSLQVEIIKLAYEPIKFQKCIQFPFTDHFKFLKWSFIDILIQQYMKNYSFLPLNQSEN